MKHLIFIPLMFLLIHSSKSQDLENILLATQEDASKLLQNYTNPVMKGLLYSLNGGWYSTAKTLRPLGFDIMISANASFVPDKEQMFDFIASEYSNISLPNGETSLPTLASKNDKETDVDVSIPYENNTFKVSSFKMPGGIAKDLPASAVPAPMIQAGLGLPLKTNIKLRLFPKRTFEDNIEAELLGLGLQHNISQYFNSKNDTIPLTFSILGAFTNMTVNYIMDDGNLTDNVSLTNGKATFDLNTWTIQLLSSLDYKFITFYLGLGYNSGSSTLKMKGDYTLTYDVTQSGMVISTITETINNPVNLDFEVSGMRATLGTRLNLGFLKIFADYTFQEYNSISGGIAFSFRE